MQGNHALSTLHINLPQTINHRKSNNRPTDEHFDMVTSCVLLFYYKWTLSVALLWVKHKICRPCDDESKWIFFSWIKYYCHCRALMWEMGRNYVKGRRSLIQIIWIWWHFHSCLTFALVRWLGVCNSRRWYDRITYGHIWGDNEIRVALSSFLPRKTHDHSDSGDDVPGFSFTHIPSERTSARIEWLDEE